MKSLLTEIRVGYEIVKFSILSDMQLRVSFAMQVGGMMLNNISFVLIWVFFFEAFGSINGWGAIEVLALQGMVAFAFGVAFSVMRGARSLPKFVNNGSFDNLLLSPRSLYARILTADTDTAAIGDMLFGALLVGIYIVLAELSVLQTFMIVSLLIPATMLMVNVAFVGSLVSFLIPDAITVTDNLFEVFLSPSLYPSGLYPGAMRFIFIFVVPALAVGGLPVEVMKSMSWGWYGIIWALAILWTVLAVKLLGRAVRRYESGNLTGIRV